MANGIARGRVRTMATTTTVESRKKAARLQILGSQRHAALVYHVLFSYMTSCYDQFTSVKSIYLLTSTTWPYLELKWWSCVLLKLTADQVPVFRLDRELMSGKTVEKRGKVSKETVVLRRWEYYKIIWFYQLSWQCKLATNRSDEGLTLETSAFESLYGG